MGGNRGDEDEFGSVVSFFCFSLDTFLTEWSTSEAFVADDRWLIFVNCWLVG